MKATGIVRKIDELGRVVIPMEIRKTMGINEKDPMEIFTDGSRIIFQKYAPGCTFCGASEPIRTFRNKPVCERCTRELMEGGE